MNAFERKELARLERIAIVAEVNGGEYYLVAGEADVLTPGAAEIILLGTLAKNGILATTVEITNAEEFAAMNAWRTYKFKVVFS